MVSDRCPCSSFQNLNYSVSLHLCEFAVAPLATCAHSWGTVALVSLPSLSSLECLLKADSVLCLRDEALHKMLSQVSSLRLYYMSQCHPVSAMLEIGAGAMAERAASKRVHGEIRRHGYGARTCSHPTWRARGSCRVEVSKRELEGKGRKH